MTIVVACWKLQFSCEWFTGSEVVIDDGFASCAATKGLVGTLQAAGALLISVQEFA